MRSYVNNLIVLTVISQIAVIISPLGWRKYVKYACALVILVSISVPIARVSEGVGGMIAGIEQIFSSDGNAAGGESGEKYYTSASVIIYWLGEKYGLNREKISVVFAEDEGGGLSGIEIYMDYCPGIYSKEIEKVLLEEFGVSVRVIAGEEK